MIKLDLLLITWENFALHSNGRLTCNILSSLSLSALTFLTLPLVQTNHI